MKAVSVDLKFFEQTLIDPRRSAANFSTVLTAESDGRKLFRSINPTISEVENE